jgi:hypothetical protein
MRPTRAVRRVGQRSAVGTVTVGQSETHLNVYAGDRSDGRRPVSLAVDREFWCVCLSRGAEHTPPPARSSRRCACWAG